MLKRLMFIIITVSVFGVTGCSTHSESEPIKDDKNIETMTENDESTEEALNGSEDVGNSEFNSENDPLKLQLLKVDEEAGLTIEDNEVYQLIQDEIETNPQMGDPNDLSLYPVTVVENEDDTMSLLIIVINRLNDPIQNMIFTLTFGNDDEEYIFNEHVVDLPEDYLGILDQDGAVPILLDIEPEDEALFNSLTPENVYLQLDDIGIDFVN